MNKIVISSGYYNPIHEGHIDYLEKAKGLGGWHIAIVNNDHQVKIKGSVPFQNQNTRQRIVRALRCVDEVILSVDQDLPVCETLRKIAEMYKIYPMTFAKGGDRISGNIPELGVCQVLGITIVDGLGQKIQSSSALIAGAKPYLVPEG